MNEELRFLVRLYLENICSDQKKNEHYFEEIKKILTEEENLTKDRYYSYLLNSIENQLKKETEYSKLDVIMFQVDEGEKINSKTMGQNVIIINPDSYLSIPMLRSELIDYYINCEKENFVIKDNRPKSQLILEIEDSIKIVKVSENQKDPMVLNFSREECYISYIQIDFLDNGKKKHVYFAIVFPVEKGNNELNIIKVIKKFLSLRYELVKRIESDFRGDMIGKKMRDEWRYRWLAIDKAGTHTDTHQGDSEIKEFEFNASNSFFPKFFKDDDSVNPLTKNSLEKYATIIKMIANKQIARIFRRIISSSGQTFSTITENVDGETIGETIMEFPKTENGIIQIQNVKYHYDDEIINNSLLFKKEFKATDELPIAGMNVCVPQSYKLKYLRAIIVDVINNICRYSNEAYIEIEETDNPQHPNYLVFKNNLVKQDVNINNYHLKKQLEFDEIYEKNGKNGFSLATIATFLNYSELGVMAYYENNCFNIKLPIIMKGDKHEQ